MSALLAGTSLEEVASCLQAKRSVLEGVDRDRLAKFSHLQAASVHPWALVIMLQADKQADFVFSCLPDTFLFCPRDLPCGTDLLPFPLPSPCTASDFTCTTVCSRGNEFAMQNVIFFMTEWG